MVRFALIPALLFSMLPSAKGQWTLQSSPTTADLRGIDNVGQGIAWASGTNGTILRTTDGTHWHLCTIPPNAEHLDFRGIQAFDANTAIAMSSGPGTQSRLYKTTDGCQIWKLIFTNPDKEGFWDALRFDRALQYKSSVVNNKQHPVSVAESRYPGVLIGDPVDGKFVIYTTFDSGDTWQPWEPHDPQFPKVARHSARAKPGESLFAASNSAALVPGIDGPLFVTGGIGGSRLFMGQTHTPFDIGTSWWAFTTIKLPINSNESSGAFSLGSRRIADYPYFDLMVVGGDYKHQDAAGSAVFLSDLNSIVSKHIITATTPPHGYRSAVAYDAPTRTWITVGPNGTDLSTDDGRNWHPLHPTGNDAPDADQQWNALSLPYAVGPHGRIGKLNPKALVP